MSDGKYKYIEIVSVSGYVVKKRIDVSAHSEGKIRRLEQAAIDQVNLKEVFVRVQDYDIPMIEEKTI